MTTGPDKIQLAGDDDQLDELLKEAWKILAAPAAPPAGPPSPARPGPPPRRLTSRQLAAIWERSKKELAQSRGSWRRAAMFPGQSGPSFASFSRAVGMVAGEPADYSLSAQETLNFVAMNPGVMPMAGPYLLLAWRRLVVADNPAIWPLPLDPEMKHAAALFKTRKDALDFINLMVSLGSSIRFSPQEHPLTPPLRPPGKPRQFPPGGVERLYDELHKAAKRIQEDYDAGRRAPRTVPFAGVRTTRNKSGWVAIWQTGWPRAWAFAVLSIMLDVKKDYLEQNL